MTDAQTFLDQSSGSRYPAFKWDKVGTTLSGKIIETPRVVNTTNMNTGKPEDKLVIAVETADGIQFSLWVRSGFLAQAISDAVKESSADGLSVGGTLHVKHTEDRDTGKPQPARVFKAKYEPPVAAVSVDDVFGGEPF